MEARLSAAIVEASQETRASEEAGELAEIRALVGHQEEALDAMKDSVAEKFTAACVSGGMQMASAGGSIAGGFTLAGATGVERGSLEALRGRAEVMNGMGKASEAAGTLGSASFQLLAGQHDIVAKKAEQRADASQVAIRQHQKRADEAQSNTQKAIDQCAELTRTRAAMNLAAVRG